jgi:hypothetical protein
MKDGQIQRIQQQTELSKPNTTEAAIEKVVLKGDLNGLTPVERVQYNFALCRSLGLNPLTHPIDYLEEQGKLKIYINAIGVAQLRERHGISTAIVRSQKDDEFIYTTARATNRNGRSEEATAVVSLHDKYGKPLTGTAKANAIMKAECVPLESEILTRDGFKTYDRLIIGEEVLAYDCQTDTTIWTPLENISVFPTSPLISLKNTNFSILCTPDHSWAVKGQPYKCRASERSPRGFYKNRQPLCRLVKASELKTSSSLILAAPGNSHPENCLPLTPIEAAILGWAVTDGSIKKYKGNFASLGVCQSKEENLPLINALFEGYSDSYHYSFHTPERTFHTGKTFKTKPQSWWWLNAEPTRELLTRAMFTEKGDLPKLVTHLSPKCRQAMLQAMMLAEGDARGIFANTDRHILEAFQILATLEGYALGIQKTRHQYENFKPVFIQRLRKTRHTSVNFLKVDEADQAPVWCPTTQYGTWIMRQNGQICITGNTKAKRRATLALCGIPWDDGEKVQRSQFLDPPADVLPDDEIDF